MVHIIKCTDYNQIIGTFVVWMGCETDHLQALGIPGAVWRCGLGATAGVPGRSDYRLAVISHPGVHPLLTRQASPAKTVAGDRRKQTGTFPSGLAGVNGCDEIN